MDTRDIGNKANILLITDDLILKDLASRYSKTNPSISVTVVNGSEFESQYQSKSFSDYSLLIFDGWVGSRDSIKLAQNLKNRLMGDITDTLESTTVSTTPVPQFAFYGTSIPQGYENIISSTFGKEVYIKGSDSYSTVFSAAKKISILAKELSYSSRMAA